MYVVFMIDVFAKTLIIPFVHSYFIKGGCVSESGTHDQLLQKRGDYYDYVQLQALGKHPLGWIILSNFYTYKYQVSYPLIYPCPLAMIRSVRKVDPVVCKDNLQTTDLYLPRTSGLDTQV